LNHTDILVIGNISRDLGRVSDIERQFVTVLQGCGAKIYAGLA